MGTLEQNLPKHTRVKLTNIFGEELEATIIPLSIKGTMDVESFIDQLKIDLTKDSEIKIERYKKTLEIENPTDDELFNSYVESKITMDLSKLNEEVTEDRIASLKKKRYDKLTEGKTREGIIQELAEILMDLEVRKNILSRTVSRTLWNVLRKPDNLREHLFVDIDELEDSIDPNTLVSIFNSNIEEAKIEEEDLKN